VTESKIQTTPENEIKAMNNENPNLQVSDGGKSLKTFIEQQQTPAAAITSAMTDSSSAPKHPFIPVTNTPARRVSDIEEAPNKKKRKQSDFSRENSLKYLLAFVTSPAKTIQDHPVVFSKIQRLSNETKTNADDSSIKFWSQKVVATNEGLLYSAMNSLIPLITEKKKVAAASSDRMHGIETINYLLRNQVDCISLGQQHQQQAPDQYHNIIHTLVRVLITSNDDIYSNVKFISLSTDIGAFILTVLTYITIFLDEQDL
jgi:hypothetical protein